MDNGLKVLMISTDRKLFEEGSGVSERIKEYGQLVGELHIVVMSDKSHGLAEKKLGSNIFLSATNSSFKFMRPRDASRIGKKIVKNKGFVRGQSLITTQDPFECGWAGLKVKSKWRIPLEVQMHIDPLFLDGYDDKLDRVRKFISRRIIKSADTIRVVGKFIEDRLLKYYNLSTRHVYVMPVFIDKEKYVTPAASFDLHVRYGWKFIMLSVARLTPQKNLPLALEILRLIKKRYPSTGLVIVGAGKDENMLKDLAKKLGVDGNTTFVGWQDDMVSYYKTANVFLQTSLFEGYGMALVEAGLSGLPVVTTLVGIANDMENGKELYICPQGDAGYFANAIADLVDNNAHRENLKLNMKSFLERTLLSKEDYLAKLKENWEKTASKVS